MYRLIERVHSQNDVKPQEMLIDSIKDLDQYFEFSIDITGYRIGDLDADGWYPIYYLLKDRSEVCFAYLKEL